MWHAFNLARNGEPTWWVWLKLTLTNLNATSRLHAYEASTSSSFSLGKRSATPFFLPLSSLQERQHRNGSQKFVNIVDFRSFFKESGRLQGNCSPSSMLPLLLTETVQGGSMQTICWFWIKLKHFHSQRHCFNLDAEAMLGCFLFKSAHPFSVTAKTLSTALLRCPPGVDVCVYVRILFLSYFNSCFIF